MRILILANIDIGLYKFRRELLEELVKENEVFVCVPCGEFTNSIKKIGCKFISCQLMRRRGINPIQEIRLIKFYRDIIKSVHPNMVFTYTIKCNAYGGMACASLGVPYIANITGLGTAIENKGFIQKLCLLIYKYGLRKAQKVFFQNTENRDFMINNGIVNTPHDLLPGSGVNIIQYKSHPYPADEYINFVFIARIMKEKGIEEYLDAAKFIKEKYPRTKFHVCGYCEQDYESMLKELSDKGIINYHGLVRNMIPIYEMASCIIHPTYYPEGMSNVLLEAAASGRPIITTDRSGCREIIDNGVNGFIVRSKDSEDLIEKIENFLKLSWEERRIMGLNGRGKVEKEFNREIVIEKYLNEVRQLRL